MMGTILPPSPPPFVPSAIVAKVLFDGSSLVIGRH